MGLSEAITAAQQAGRTDGPAIHKWLIEATGGDPVSNGRKLNLDGAVDMLGIERASVLLASLQALADNGQADVTLRATAGGIAVLFTSGGSIQTGQDSTAAVLASLVTAQVLTNDERTALIAFGQRPQIRADLYGVTRVPEPFEIQKELG